MKGTREDYLETKYRIEAGLELIKAMNTALKTTKPHLIPYMIEKYSYYKGRLLDDITFMYGILEKWVCFDDSLFSKRELLALVAKIKDHNSESTEQIKTEERVVTPVVAEYFLDYPNTVRYKDDTNFANAINKEMAMNIGIALFNTSDINYEHRYASKGSNLRASIKIVR